MSMRGSMGKMGERVLLSTLLSNGLQCDRCEKTVLGKKLRYMMETYKRVSTYRIVDNWVIPCFICHRCRAELARKDFKKREK